MFDKTYSEILQDLLDSVDNAYDKREGSVIYYALAPAALEIKALYDAMDSVINETFADTASKEYLVRRAKERGLSLNSATSAIVKAVFTPSSIGVIGKRFSCGDVNFVTTEYVSDGVYYLTCETAGEAGNIASGTLIPIDYVQGLQTAQIAEIITTGEAEEDTETFRKRYFDSFVSQSYGGNVDDYKEYVGAISGVGGVKVYPVWNGGGTVKVVIQDSEYGVPSDTFVSEVQETIDPDESGTGVGIAPIGHKVTIEGVTSETINISSVYTFQSGYTWDDVKTNAESAIDAYFTELNKAWPGSQNIVVRISQIESRLLDVDGVIDIANTAINGAASNHTVGADAVVVRGTVTSE